MTTTTQKELWEELRDMEAQTLDRALKTALLKMGTATLAQQTGFLSHQIRRGTPESTVLAAFCRGRADETSDTGAAAQYLQTAAFHTSETDTETHEGLAQKFRTALEKTAEKDMAQACSIATLARAKSPGISPLSLTAVDFVLKNADRKTAGAMLVRLASDVDRMTPDQQDSLFGRIYRTAYHNPYPAAVALQRIVENAPFGSALAERAEAGFRKLSEIPEAKYELQRREFGMVFATSDGFKPL